MRIALYWLLLVLLVLGMEGVALFYQYRLDYWPCVLCIHVRIWLLLILIIALPMVFLRQRWLDLSGHLAVSLVGAGLGYTSWQLLGIERGFITGGSCGMSLGLPSWLSWFKIDQWFPWMFEVQTPCGYTPELLFGVTMAEALLVMSILLIAISCLFIVFQLKTKPHYD